MAAADAPLYKRSANEIIVVGQRFRPIPRVSAVSRELGLKIAEHMASGVPLLVYDCAELEGWDEDAFGVDAFQHGTPAEQALYRYAQAARAGPAVKVEDASTMDSAYMKDHPCPASWERQLHALQGPIQTLMPLSDSDLTTFLSEKARPETLMCYVGRQGTRTALHRDRCASVGQNLMAHTEGDGHSLWLMTETADADKVSRHFSSDDVVVEFEHHEASLEELAEAEFTVYIGEQRTGDLIYVPTRSTHQVINRGGLTCKIAWSRMSEQSLTLSLTEDLPIYNVLRVPEVYRTKLLLHSVVLGLTAQLTAAGTFAVPAATKMLEQLLPQYDRLICEEWTEEEIPLADSPEEALLVCDSCGQDIFRVYWVCDGDDVCKTAEEETVLLCSACYTIGRTCACRAMRPLALLSVERMVEVRNAAAVVLQGAEHVRNITSVLSLGHLAMTHAAELIHAKRTEPAKHITCHYLNYHAIWAVEGHFCRRCGRRVCFRCFAARARVHAAEVLLTPYEPDELHALHRGEREPRAASLGAAIARAHLARPPPAGTAGGWYDPDEDAPSASAAPEPKKRKREVRVEELGDEQLALELSGWRTARKRRSTEGKMPNGRGMPVPLTSRGAQPQPPTPPPPRSRSRARPRASGSRRARASEVTLEDIREQGVELLGWELPEVPPRAEAPSEREEYAEKLAGKLMQVLAEQQKVQSRLGRW